MEADNKEIRYWLKYIINYKKDYIYVIFFVMSESATRIQDFLSTFQQKEKDFLQPEILSRLFDILETVSQKQKIKFLNSLFVVLSDKQKAYDEYDISFNELNILKNQTKKKIGRLFTKKGRQITNKQRRIYASYANISKAKNLLMGNYFESWAPFGYQIKKEWNTYIVTQKNPEAEGLKWVLQDLADGKISRQCELFKAYYSRVPTLNTRKRGKFVTKIFKNEERLWFYAWYFKYSKFGVDVPFKAGHEPLIDLQTFKKIIERNIFPEIQTQKILQHIEHFLAQWEKNTNEETISEETEKVEEINEISTTIASQEEFQWVTPLFPQIDEEGLWDKIPEEIWITLPIPDKIDIPPSLQNISLEEIKTEIEQSDTKDNKFPYNAWQEINDYLQICMQVNHKNFRSVIAQHKAYIETCPEKERVLEIIEEQGAEFKNKKKYPIYKSGLIEIKKIIRKSWTILTKKDFIEEANLSVEGKEGKEGKEEKKLRQEERDRSTINTAIHECVLPNLENFEKLIVESSLKMGHYKPLEKIMNIFPIWTQLKEEFKKIRDDINNRVFNDNQDHRIGKKTEFNMIKEYIQEERSKAEVDPIRACNIAKDSFKKLYDKVWMIKREYLKWYT